MTVPGLTIRNAVFDQALPPEAPVNADVLRISGLLGIFAEKHLLLPRPPEDVLEKIRNFRIAEVNGIFAGCVALRDYGDELYEVRSLAVVPEFDGKGIGSAMVQLLMEQMRESGRQVRLFALTYRSGFFLRLGFQLVSKEMFPQKIWSDCRCCPKFHCCDETAVLLEL